MKKLILNKKKLKKLISFLNTGKKQSLRLQLLESNLFK